MTATVEDRHRWAAMACVSAASELGLTTDTRPIVVAVAKIIAGTEAAERERSAALRAEFAACVRALRWMEARFQISGDARGPGRDDAVCCHAVRAALSGPLAREVADA